MRQLVLGLVLSAATVAPAHASLVYLNDIGVLDTNRNLVWLAPWVIALPVSAYWPGERMFLVRESVVPIRAAAWLFGEALGWLGFAKRRVA